MGAKGYVGGVRRLLRHPSLRIPKWQSRSKQSYELLYHSSCRMHKSLPFKCKRVYTSVFPPLTYPINNLSFKKLKTSL